MCMKLDKMQPFYQEKSSFSIKMQLNVNNFDEFLAKLHEIEEKWA